MLAAARHEPHSSPQPLWHCSPASQAWSHCTPPQPTPSRGQPAWTQRNSVTSLEVPMPWSPCPRPQSLPGSLGTGCELLPKPPPNTTSGAASTAPAMDPQQRERRHRGQHHFIDFYFQIWHFHYTLLHSQKGGCGHVPTPCQQSQETEKGKKMPTHSPKGKNPNSRRMLPRAQVTALQSGTKLQTGLQEADSCFLTGPAPQGWPPALQGWPPALLLSSFWHLTLALHLAAV